MPSRTAEAILERRNQVNKDYKDATAKKPARPDESIPLADVPLVKDFRRGMETEKLIAGQREHSAGQKREEELFDYGDIRDLMADARASALASSRSWTRLIGQQPMDGTVEPFNPGNDHSTSAAIPSGTEIVTDPHPLQREIDYMAQHIYPDVPYDELQEAADRDFTLRVEEDPGGQGTIQSGYDLMDDGRHYYTVEGEDMTRNFIVDPDTGEVFNVTDL
tara:strand:+ start:59 stop:718 length:660 start_codon:yes stop_codon:yes gene_type:complete